MSRKKNSQRNMPLKELKHHHGSNLMSNMTILSARTILNRQISRILN
jgi:hypothetical protein